MFPGQARWGEVKGAETRLRARGLIRRNIHVCLAEACWVASIAAKPAGGACNRCLAAERGQFKQSRLFQFALTGAAIYSQEAAAEAGMHIERILKHTIRAQSWLPGIVRGEQGTKFNLAKVPFKMTHGAPEQRRLVIRCSIAVDMAM